MKVYTRSDVEIRRRAFELFIQRGAQPGHELDDWLQAEFEVTHLPFHIPRLLPLQGRHLLRRQRGQFPVRFSKH